MPAALGSTLRGLGHDVISVVPATPDIENAQRAKREERILVTLDKDFTNTRMYPPKEFNIVRIQIHPPTKEALIESFKKLLAVFPNEMRGLIILRRDGHFRYT